MTFRNWRDLTADDFRDPGMSQAIAVLPLAATEQHGPHLPTGTDSIIAEGLIREAASRQRGRADVLVLPVQEIGASLEHASFPGTLSASAAQLIDLIICAGESVAAAGIGKLVLVSSHGGNIAAMTAAALECRERFGMLAVTLTWNRLGFADAIVDEGERRFGAHGGLVETSLMLHFRPDLVRMERAGDFRSRQQDLADRHTLLRAYGPIGFGWLAEDLNPQGVTGNAAAATAEIGAAIAAHQAEAFLTLLDEIAAEDAEALFATP